jgi:hypothetical protein
MNDSRTLQVDNKRASEILKMDLINLQRETGLILKNFRNKTVRFLFILTER